MILWGRSPLLARVHQACIPPVANYGCELWGLRNMATRQARQREKLLMAHVNMLRGIIGARKSTPQALVFLESHSAPLSDSWLQQSITFWNNLAGLPPTSLFRRIALDSVAQALLGTHNWATSLVTSLAAVGYTLVLHLGDFQGIDPLFIKRLLAARRISVFSPNEGNLDPRTCPSEGVIVCTYGRWFQRPAWVRVRSPLIRLPLPSRDLRLFFRFRVGCSGLPIDTGRRTRPHPTPRAQRVCVKCASQSVCDEYHVVFECPALAPLRGQYSSLFTPATRSMVRFMWQLDTCAVAMFVAHALRFMDVAGT